MFDFIWVCIMIGFGFAVGSAILGLVVYLILSVLALICTATSYIWNLILNKG